MDKEEVFATHTTQKKKCPKYMESLESNKNKLANQQKYG